MLRPAGAEIRIPCFKRILLENVQTFQYLLCPQQGRCSACRDQVSVGNRRLVNIEALAFIAGAEHIEKPDAVACVWPVIQETGMSQGNRCAANGTHRTTNGQQLRSFLYNGLVLRIIPGIPARQQQNALIVDGNIIDNAVGKRKPESAGFPNIPLIGASFRKMLFVPLPPWYNGCDFRILLTEKETTWRRKPFT